MPKSETSLEQLLYDVKRIAKSREKLSEKKITAIYQNLMDNLSKFLSKQYIKYADDDGRLFISYLDAQRSRAKFLQEIAKNVDGLSVDLLKEMESLIDDTYKECYKGMKNAILKADETGNLEAVTEDIVANPNVIRQSVKNNISKLTLTPMMEKYRNEITYKIQQELTTGLMQGDRYDQMAKRIAQQINVSETRAKLIARTETHRNIETGFMDCAEHLQDGLDGSGYIYAATWRTMKDERVRPNKRVKTKHGWKIVKGKGANHVKMDGVTIKAGEQFDLGDGVTTKCPGQSGVAAHDCNCRCFLKYDLLTPKEFYEKTGRNVSLSKAQEEAVKDYTGIYGKSVNSYMNGKKSNITEKEERIIETLHNTLNQTIVTKDSVLYRGGGLSVFGKDKRTILNDPQKAVGRILTNNGFMSTSKTLQAAKSFSNPDYDKLILYVMDVPKGTKGLDIGELSILGYESEVLLQDHTRFKITKVVEKDDRIVFSCKVLEND